MKLKVLFNDIYQNSKDVFANESIVNSLFDRNDYDFSVILFFSYLPNNKPYLCSYILTKLNGKDKYHCYFHRIDDNYMKFNLKMDTIKSDLKERVELNYITSFDYNTTNEALLNAAKNILENKSK